MKGLKTNKQEKHLQEESRLAYGNFLLVKGC